MTIFKRPCTFSNLQEADKYFDSVLKKINKSARKMPYFYYQLLFKNIFLNNAENIYYKYVEKEDFNKNFLKEEDAYIYFSKTVDGDVADNKFDYRVNNNSFRSDHFEKINENNYNILANGCSVTFGMGLPENYIWPTLLEKNIKVKKNKNLYNIGVCGLDTVQMINNFYTFINLFGKPDVCFMVVPPIYRFAHMYTKKDRISTYQEVPWLPDKTAITELMFNNDTKYSLGIFYNISSIRNLETFCNNVGIKLFWFSWDEASQEYYEMFEFDNLITGTNNMFKDITNNNKLDYWEIARDNSHLGLKHHERFSNIFYQQGIKNEIWN